jgi:hypothetical protein
LSVTRRTWISIGICRGLFCVQWFEVRGTVRFVDNHCSDGRKHDQYFQFPVNSDLKQILSSDLRSIHLISHDYNKWIESLNSNRPHFYQYQQNEQYLFMSVLQFDVYLCLYYSLRFIYVCCCSLRFIYVCITVWGLFMSVLQFVVYLCLYYSLLFIYVCYCSLRTVIQT